jgi:glycosyltransferase involved in cell wall biosynthesis
LHYKWKTPHGALFLGVESALLRRTDGLIFVCDYERRAFVEKIGEFSCRHAIIHNGLSDDEFAPVKPAPEASDILFIGELRMLKGVDVLIEAIASLRARGREVTATIVGDGPDRKAFEKMVARRSLQDAITMPGAMPAAKAFPLGRVMAVPSRAESFPYVVLEAQGAARPVIATDVGGISEMLPPESLVPPGDSSALAAKIASVLDDPNASAHAAQRLETLKAQFSVSAMADKALAFYQSLL